MRLLCCFRGGILCRGRMGGRTPELSGAAAAGDPSSSRAQREDRQDLEQESQDKSSQTLQCQWEYLEYGKEIVSILDEEASDDEEVDGYFRTLSNFECSMVSPFLNAAKEKDGARLPS
jgi:hypothetical protein